MKFCWVRPERGDREMVVDGGGHFSPAGIDGVHTLTLLFSSLTAHHRAEGIWEQRRTTANGFVTAGVDSSQGGRTPSPPERSTSTRTFAGIFSTAAIQENRRRKTPSQQNKQFDPGGRGEKAPSWNAAVTLPFFSGGELGSSLLVFCLCFFLLLPLCVFVFRTYFSFHT